MILLVTYELTHQLDEYDNFFNILFEQGAYQLFENCLVIFNPAYTALGLRSHLLPHIYNNDSLFIARANGADTAGILKPKAKDWYTKTIYIPAKKLRDKEEKERAEKMGYYRM